MLVLTEFPPRIGGMQTHALYLSRYLAQRGYEIDVVTYQPASAAERAATASLDRELGFPVHRCISRLGFWHGVETIARLARRTRPALVYCSTVFYGYLRGLLDVPVISRSVGNDVMRPWIAYPFRTASRMLATPQLDEQIYRLFRHVEYPELIEMMFRQRRAQLMRESAHQMALILANSHYTAELLAAIDVPPERIRVLVGGVESSRFAGFDQAERRSERAKLREQLSFNAGDFVMTTACRLVAKKGIDFLLGAFRALRRVLPRARLMVIGDGRHARRYRRQAHADGLGERVLFTGAVDHQQIHRYYWASDMFVLASRVQRDPATGLRDAETMGRVLCEANAAGVPTVAARSGGIPSVITHGNNGLLFAPDDEQQLIEQVMAIQDRRLASRLIDGGRRAARRFDWSVVLAEHERQFERTLGAGSRADPWRLSD